MTESLKRTGRDFSDAIRLWRLALDGAWLDWRRRYSRSALGVAWVFISFAAFVGVKIVIFGAMSDFDIAFFAVWLSCGFLLWQLISGILVDGCSVFLQNDRMIKANNYPLFSFIFQSIAKNAIRFLISFLFFILILLYFGAPPIGAWVWVVPALAIYLVNAVWAQLFLGVLAARFNDIMHFVQTAVRLLFFLSPILWVPGQFGRFGELSDYNPITHYLAIVRDPLVGREPPFDSWVIVSSITVVGVALALVVFARFRNRLIFWV